MSCQQVSQVRAKTEIGVRLSKSKIRDKFEGFFTIPFSFHLDCNLDEKIYRSRDLRSWILILFTPSTAKLEGAIGKPLMVRNDTFARITSRCKWSKPCVAWRYPSQHHNSLPWTYFRVEDRLQPTIEYYLPLCKFKIMRKWHSHFRVITRFHGSEKFN